MNRAIDVRGLNKSFGDKHVVRDVSIASVQTCSLMGLIIIGATILGNAVAFLGLPNEISRFGEL